MEESEDRCPYINIAGFVSCNANGNVIGFGKQVPEHCKSWMDCDWIRIFGIPTNTSRENNTVLEEEKRRMDRVFSLLGKIKTSKRTERWYKWEPSIIYGWKEEEEGKKYYNVKVTPCYRENSAHTNYMGDSFSLQIPEEILDEKDDEVIKAWLKSRKIRKE